MSTRPTALITGASEGIGRELAGLFAADGYDLILVSRNRNRLEALAQMLKNLHSGTVQVVAKDLAQSAAPQELYQHVLKSRCTIDVLVNNAGFGTYGKFSSLEWAPEAELLQLNIVSLTQLTRLFLPAMLEQHAGKILNVASVAAYFPGPLMTTYYASKAYVRSFTNAVADEIRGSGVTISLLCPGPTKTQFHARALMEDARLVSKRRRMSSEKVARIGYHGLMKGKRIILPGWQNKILSQVSRCIPDALAARAVGYLHERDR
jgi:short-subunit dehydrogenase